MAICPFDVIVAVVIQLNLTASLFSAPTDYNRKTQPVLRSPPYAVLRRLGLDRRHMRCDEKFCFIDMR
jgi:hypothetical protein